MLLYFCLSVILSFCLISSQFIFCSSQFFLVNRNLPGSPLSPFSCIFIFLPFCLPVVLSLCLSALVCLVHFCSFQFILVHWDSPTESFLVSFHISVLLSFCHSSLCPSVSHSSSLAHLRSSQFIGGRPSSSRVILFISWCCRALSAGSDELDSWSSVF